MSEWTICVTPMPTEEALDLAARIADAEDPDCERLLFGEGPQVCDVLRCEVLHQAEVIERLTAELSTAMGEIARLRAALAGAHEIINGRTVPPTDEEIDAHRVAGGGWIVGDRPFYLSVEVRDARALCERRAALHVAELPMWPPYRWIALDRDGKPCVWPVAEVTP